MDREVFTQDLIPAGRVTAIENREVPHHDGLVLRDAHLHIMPARRDARPPSGAS
jgi:hypothetical protein